MSVAATLAPEEYSRSFVAFFCEKRDFGFYGACFVQLAMMVGIFAQKGGYVEALPYFLDTGNPYKQHVKDAHAEILEHQRTHPMNVGVLRFCNDADMSALQAADLVSWSVRRRLVGSFTSGFEPLLRIFDAKHIDGKCCKAR